jgi:hypothetical protein
MQDETQPIYRHQSMMVIKPYQEEEDNKVKEEEET